MINLIFEKRAKRYTLAFLWVSFAFIRSSYAESVMVHTDHYHPNFVEKSHYQKPLEGHHQRVFSSIDAKQQVIIAHGFDKGYLTFVLAKILNQHLPIKLALIPLIESGYEENAISPKGAGGLWQLMPETAKDLGITSNDRFKLNEATIAALKHLTHLNNEFGDWHLAISAYNCGRLCLKKAMTKSKIMGTPLDLPQETKAYLKQFMTLEHLIDDMS